jgi:hypothetical protein
MRKISFSVAAAVAVALSAGCAQSAKLAQHSYDRGMDAQRGVRNALFVKGWGMTRIAGQEANNKELALAKVDLLRSQLDKTFSPEKSEEILDRLGDRIAHNEPLVSKSFAWLSFLMQQGDKADEMLGNVDFYLESQHPIWQQLSEQVPGTMDDAKQAFESWKDLLGPVWDSIKKIFQPADKAVQPQ